MTAHEKLREIREDNPTLRYALRREPAANGGEVIGAFCTNVGGFIPVLVETGKESGVWSRMPIGYLEIGGKAVGIEPDAWHPTDIFVIRPAFRNPS